MRRATKHDRDVVVKILSRAFEDNKSVNYIVRQDKFRRKRIKALMDYSFQVCHLFGCVYLSDDNNACALISFPDQKKATFKSIFLDIKLIIKATGWRNISKVLTRERVISKNYPNAPIYYLWFIGVLPEYQNQGLGKEMLREIVEEARMLKRPIYLETSSEKNVPWYQNAGFEIYNQLDFGYPLYLLKTTNK